MTRLYLLCCYDVDTTTKEGARRLRKVAKACEAYGTRVQKSVFEIAVTEVDHVKLIKRVTDILESTTDTFRVYRLPGGFEKSVTVYGVATGDDFEKPLVL